MQTEKLAQKFTWKRGYGTAFVMNHLSDIDLIRAGCGMRNCKTIKGNDNGNLTILPLMLVRIIIFKSINTKIIQQALTYHRNCNNTQYTFQMKHKGSTILYSTCKFRNEFVNKPFSLHNKSTVV